MTDTVESITYQRDKFKKELIDVMERCADEIRTLRNRVQALEPKAEAYDAILSILDLLPRQRQGEGEDLAWRLNKRIETLRAETKTE